LIIDIFVLFVIWCLGFGIYPQIDVRQFVWHNMAGGKKHVKTFDYGGG
jgi:hypothetical protein